MSFVANFTRKNNRRLKKNGFDFALNARKEHDHQIALSLGYKNAQEAYNSLGKEFLSIAKKGRVSFADNKKIGKQINDALDLIKKGWDIDLAVDCSHDVIYDIISKEAFIEKCMKAIKC